MERIRAQVRDILGYQSWLYKFAASVLDVYFAISREGLEGLRLLRMKGQSGEGVWMTFRHLESPIFVRPGSEDVVSIIDNVLREEYGQLPDNFSPTTVLDAGAYIGDTTAYFLSRFKDASIIALEPSAENFKLAAQNLASYGESATLLPYALWDSKRNGAIVR